MSLGLLKPESKDRSFAEQGVSLPILAEVLGVAKSTAAYWARLGLIEPIEGSKPRRYLVPSPEKKERIREAMRERLKVGASKGGQTASKLGLSASHAAKAREALAKSPEAPQKATQTRLEQSAALVPAGLVDGPTLCQQAGIGLSTLLRWRKGGYIAHAYQCPRLHTLYFAPLTPEQVQELREKGGEKQGLAQTRLASRPAGYVTAEEAVQLAEVDITTIKSAGVRGLIDTTKVRRWLWFREESVQTWRSRRGLARQPRMCQIPAEPHKAKALPINRATKSAPPVSQATTRPVDAPALPPDGEGRSSEAPGSDLRGDYLSVIAEAKSVPAFCGVLGFNVWRHNFTGEYQAAGVSEKPQWPWRYHQKHYRNGWGHWSVASMNPSTGRVDL